MRLWLLCFLILLYCACSSRPGHQDNPFSIRLSADSQSIYIHGIDYATLQELKKDTLDTENWQAMFPVYKMPVDTDMKDLQRELPGIYSLTDSSIVFKPDTAFQKHQPYFARFYGNSTSITTSQLIRSKANLKGPAYIEVVF